MFNRKGWPMSLALDQMDLTALAATLLYAVTLAVPVNTFIVLRGRSNAISAERDCAATLLAAAGLREDGNPTKRSPNP
jgi:hypothetical protein